MIIHLALGKANPNRLNGINKVVHHLALAQMEAGQRVEVWGITPTPSAETPARPYPLRLFRASRTRFWLASDLRKAIQALEGGAVLHFHGGLLPEFYCVSRYLRQGGIPWVVTPHGCLMRHSLRKHARRKKLFIALFDRHILAEAHKVQVFSVAERSDCAHLVPASKLVVIRNGEDPRPRARELLKSRLGKCRFGFCGRLDAGTKGLDLLIAGFAVYVESGGQGALCVIGDGPDREILKGLAGKLGISDRIVFHGKKFGAQKTALLSGLDVFVHPSRHEGMPMSVLEAAALGLPLLITEGTNLGEPVARWKAGTVLKTNDATSLGAAMLEFERAGRQRLAGIGENSLEMIKAEFSWPTIAKRTIESLYPSKARQAV